MNSKTKIMKKIVLIASLLFLTTIGTQAQVSVNINFGTPPVWAPEDHVEVQYYYLPEIDVYYDVPQRQFIYISNRRWIRSGYLPNRCKNYNLRGGNIVYLTDYRGNSPYVFHGKHRMRYYRPEVRPNEVYVVDRHDDDHDRGEHRGHGRKEKSHGRR